MMTKQRRDNLIDVITRTERERGRRDHLSQHELSGRLSYRYRAPGGRRYSLNQPSETGNNHASYVRLHRVLTTRAEKVYRAFLDALAKWILPDGFACTVHDPKSKVARLVEPGIKQ
jgi:hypothetical protein